MRLDRLTIEGLKSSDRVLDFGAVNLLVGPNGSGKSSVLYALCLLAHGRLTGARDASTEAGVRIPKTADGVMLLARGDKIRIRGEFALDDGSKAAVDRAWTRGRKGSVSESIELAGWKGAPSSLAEKRAFLALRLGGFSEAWAPMDFLSANASEMRRRIVAMLPASEADLHGVVPVDCPSWAAPIEGESSLQWAAVAMHRARGRLSEAKDEARDAESRISWLQSHWRADLDTQAARDRVADLEAELERLRAHEALLTRLMGRENELLNARYERASAVDAELIDINRGRLACRDCFEIVDHVCVPPRTADQIEMDIEILRAELDEFGPVRKRSEIDADIEKAREDLLRAVAMESWQEKLDEAKADLDCATRSMQVSEMWIEKFNVALTRAMQQSKAWLEDRFRALLSAPVSVDLYDARGNETCRISIGGVPIAAVSGGELAMFCVGLALATADQHRDGWRVLPMDRIESLDGANRRALYSVAIDSVRSGELEQVFLAGCVEDHATLDGLNVIRFPIEKA